MSDILSEKLKSERGIYSVLTALNPKRLEEMITDAEALEKQLKGCLEKCRDEANNLLMGISTPISPDDFDKLINDMRQIGK